MRSPQLLTVTKFRQQIQLSSTRSADAQRYNGGRLLQPRSENHRMLPKKSHWPVSLVAILLIYALSSGPMLATAFWLREATGVDAFYHVMWLYVPVLMLPRPIWDGYISWWVDLFGTVGPG